MRRNDTTITLQLSSDTERRLVALAHKNGQDLEAFLQHLLKTVSDTAEHAEGEVLSNSTILPIPEIVDKGGVHVVRAQAIGDLDHVLQCEREERMAALQWRER